MDSLSKNFDILPIKDSWLKQFKEQPISLTRYMEDELFNKTRDSFEEGLKANVISNLRRLGFSFRSDEEFLNFCKYRITRIAFDEDPNCYDIYLDFKDENDRGVLITTYCHKVTIDRDNFSGRITLIIG